MKIGTLELRSPFVRNQTNGRKPPTSELGQTGTAIFNGQLGPVVDYNDALNPPQSYDTYDKMRLGDPTVAAAIRVIKMPLLNAEWNIEPASDGGQDREIAERLEMNLKQGLNISWHAMLRQILLHLDYGNAPFEKVYRIVDGFVELQKLAFRHPKTITKWNVDDHGGLSGIEQTTAPTFRPTPIDVSKLVVFINELEGSNFHGISILRPAVKPWTYIDGLERVESIGIEKRANGVDVGKLIGEGITEERKRDAERALQTVHGHQKMYMTEIDGQFEYRIQGIQGDVLDPNQAITRHTWAVLRAMLVEFLGMGTGSTGSLAMSRDKTSMSLLALGGIANNIRETMDRHLIKPLVDYNWTVKEYPRLIYTHLDARPLAEFADAIQKLSEAGALTRTLDVENAARAMLDLPPAVEGQATTITAEAANALGILFRSGFDPIAASKALGLPEIEHTGFLPVTLQRAEELEEPDEMPMEEPEEPENIEQMPVEQLRAVATLARRELKRRREGVTV